MKRVETLLIIATFSLTVCLVVIVSSQRPVARPVSPSFVRVISPPPKQDDLDVRVLRDPLQPAVNRTDYETHHELRRAVVDRKMYANTREDTDRFRLVAYLSSSDEKKDAGGNRWKLFARQKDRNRAEFYLVPVDQNYDMKISVGDDMVVGERLRDVYTIPKRIAFDSPLLNRGSYDVVELPMADVSTRYA